LGAGCSVICYMILNYIIEKMPAHHASALQVNLVTITAVVAGVLIRGDDFGWYTVVGLIMMLGGIILLSRQEAKKKGIELKDALQLADDGKIPGEV
ncbi:MAG: EamA family transporter, partial [Eubacteriales bacterium]|nr:EamA family transporter [Eubacteriales bacterium]